MLEMNPKTRKMLPEDSDLQHMATLVRQSRSGERIKTLLVKNDIGVFGTLFEGSPYVVWGSPSAPTEVFDKMQILMGIGIIFYIDDGHVLRQIESSAELYEKILT